MSEDKEQKEEFLKYTNENEVLARPAWKLMNKLEMFKKYQVNNINEALWLEERVVNIPSSVRI